MGAIEDAKREAEKLAGQAKEAAGKVTGNKDTEAEGQGDQASAKVKGVGDSIKDAANKAKGVFGG